MSNTSSRHFAAAILAAFLAAFCFSAAAQADTIGSAPLTHPDEKVAICQFSNLGSSTVTIKSVKILKGTGAPVHISLNQCSTPLAPFTACIAAAKVAYADDPHFCKAVTIGSAAGLRGDFSLQTAPGVILVNTPVR